MKVSDLTAEQESIVDVLSHISDILVAASEEIRAPAPHLLPDYVDVASIRVHHVAVVEVDGVICVRMYDANNGILAMLEVASDPIIHFYPEDGAEQLTVNGDRNVVVFIRF